MGLWSQEVMNKTLSSSTNQLYDLESYLNSLGFNFLIYKTGHKMDCFMEQFEGCSRNVLLLPLSSLPSFLFFHPSFRFYCLPILHLLMFFGKDSETWLEEKYRAELVDRVGWEVLLCAWEGLTGRGVLIERISARFEGLQPTKGRRPDCVAHLLTEKQVPSRRHYIPDVGHNQELQMTSIVSDCNRCSE